MGELLKTWFEMLEMSFKNFPHVLDKHDTELTQHLLRWLKFEQAKNRNRCIWFLKVVTDRIQKVRIKNSKVSWILACVSWKKPVSGPCQAVSADLPDTALTRSWHGLTQAWHSTWHETDTTDNSCVSWLKVGWAEFRRWNPSSSHKTRGQGAYI